MIDLGKRNILGVGISAIDYDGCIERVAAAAKERRALTVSAMAVHGVMTGALDPVQRYRLNQFDMLVPDGQPIRWALSWLHRVRLPERVYGPSLMLRVCERAAADGLPIFLFGSTDEMLAALKTRLIERFPRLNIAGMRASRFRRLSHAERDSIVSEIRASGAALTFIGLGCPRQEVWAFEFREALSMPLIAVGAAFAFHAGVLAQAPSHLQDWGLEWLFRLVHEPRRLWRRYLLLNPTFLTLLALELASLHVVEPEGAPPVEEMLYG